MKKFLILFNLLGVVLFTAQTVHACESCVVSRIGKDRALISAESENHKFYFQYLFEQKNWDVMDADIAHELHHDGHHVHDKTTEDLHHFRFGSQINDNLHIFADLPYVIRRSLEVDTHAIVGSQQTAEGFGDMSLIGDYRIWHQDNHAISAVLGLKLPTGATHEKNSIGNRFDASLQPGTGSTDYLLGGIYRFSKDRSTITTNMSYFIKTEGGQDFKQGDVLTTALYFEYQITPKDMPIQAYFGGDLIYQNEWKEKEAEMSIKDSGGVTLLAGPSLRVAATDRVNVQSSIAFPIHQNLGGIHQELDYEWTLGSQIKF